MGHRSDPLPANFRLSAERHDLAQLARKVNTLQSQDRAVPDWMLTRIADLKAAIRDIQGRSDGPTAAA